MINHCSANKFRVSITLDFESITRSNYHIHLPISICLTLEILLPIELKTTPPLHDQYHALIDYVTRYEFSSVWNVDD